MIKFYDFETFVKEQDIQLENIQIKKVDINGIPMPEIDEDSKGSKELLDTHRYMSIQELLLIISLIEEPKKIDRSSKRNKDTDSCKLDDDDEDSDDEFYGEPTEKVKTKLKSIAM